LSITGAILTKLDGDTRGGAALSLREVTNIPIKYMGLGEKLDQIEVFHPERMASRILGMGDILSLVEKATEEIDEEEALSMMEKMMTGKFNYNDLLKQMKMIKRMGKFSGILKMLPGMKSLGNMDKVDDKQLEYIEAIVGSMTEDERKDPELITRSSSRRNRIARGSGRSYSEINKLVDMLEKQQTLMRRMQGMNPDSLQNMAQGNFEPKASRSDRRDKMKKKGGFRF